MINPQETNIAQGPIGWINQNPLGYNWTFNDPLNCPSTLFSLTHSNFNIAGLLRRMYDAAFML